MKNSVYFYVALAAISISLIPRADGGTVLPAATDSLFFAGGVTSNDLPGGLSLSVDSTCELPGCSGSENASATLAPGVMASASCIDCSFGVSGIVAAATTNLTYSFEIEGSVTEQVPIMFSYNEAGSANALAAAYLTPAWAIVTEFLIYANPGFSDEFDASSSGPCEERINGTIVGSEASCSGFVKAGQTELSLMSNTVYNIGLAADIFTVTDASVSVSVDPYIQVDPTFSDAGLFTVQLSPGIGNSMASVPEPGTAGATFFILVALFIIRAKTRPNCMVSN